MGRRLAAGEMSPEEEACFLADLDSMDEAMLALRAHAKKQLARLKARDRARAAERVQRPRRGPGAAPLRSV